MLDWWIQTNIRGKILPAFCIQWCPLLAAEDCEILIPLSSTSMNVGWLTEKHAADSQTPRKPEPGVFWFVLGTCIFSLWDSQFHFLTRGQQTVGISCSS